MPIISTVSNDIDSIVQRTALKYNVPVELVRAIIQTESSWNPSAYRAEPKISDASWGLMQVLLKTARDISGNSNLTASELLKPETNIDIGTKYISQQLKRYGNNTSNAIAAYNAGSAKFTSAGYYINQDYVDKVNKWLAYYKAKGYVTKAGLPTLGIVALGAMIGLLATTRN